MSAAMSGRMSFEGDLLGSFSLRKFCLRMCVFCGVFFVVQARMETSAHLCRERTCGETEPASSSWAEPEIDVFFRSGQSLRLSSSTLLRLQQTFLQV